MSSIRAHQIPRRGVAGSCRSNLYQRLCIHIHRRGYIQPREKDSTTLRVGILHYIVHILYTRVIPTYNVISKYVYRLCLPRSFSTSQTHPRTRTYESRDKLLSSFQDNNPT